MARRRGGKKTRARRFIWRDTDITIVPPTATRGDDMEASMPQQLYSIYIADEGGFGQRLALALLRGEGIRCAPAPSPFVGQTGVLVYGGKRVQQKAARILYSY